MLSSGQWGLSAGVIEPPAPVSFAAARLRLYPRAACNPAEEYWGELVDTIPVVLAQVIAGGRRGRYEFERLLPLRG